MKLSEVYKLKAGIDQIGKKDIPTVVAYKLKTLYVKLSGATAISDELKDKLIIEKYGEKQQTGEYRIVDSDKQREFESEYGKLLAEDIDVGELPKIPLSSLKNIELSIQTCILLDEILQDG